MISPDINLHNPPSSTKAMTRKSKRSDSAEMSQFAESSSAIRPTLIKVGSVTGGTVNSTRSGTTTTSGSGRSQFKLIDDLINSLEELRVSPLKKRIKKRHRLPESNAEKNTTINEIPVTADDVDDKTHRTIVSVDSTGSGLFPSTTLEVNGMNGSIQQSPTSIFSTAASHTPQSSLAGSITLPSTPISINGTSNTTDDTTNISTQYNHDTEPHGPDERLCCGSANVENRAEYFDGLGTLSENVSDEVREAAPHVEMPNGQGIFLGSLQGPIPNGVGDIPQVHPQIVPHHLRYPSDEDYEESESKGCCGISNPAPSTFIRAFIAVISILGLCCVITGIVLGALTVTGTTRLTLCLLMIGVGVVLITVSGIAWRLTSIDPNRNPSCWAILGLRQNGQAVDNHHSLSRRPLTDRPRRGRPIEPSFRRARSPRRRHRLRFTSMPPNFGVCGDFLWQPPPPSYQTYLQECRMQRFFENMALPLDPAETTNPGPGSPPPTYNSHASTPARPSISAVIDNVPRPPSYRTNDVTSIHSTLQNTISDNQAMAPATDRVDASERQRLLHRVLRSSRSLGTSVPQIETTQPQSTTSSTGISNPIYDATHVNNNVALRLHTNSDAAQNDLSIVRIDNQEERISIIDCSRHTPVVFDLSHASSSTALAYTNSEPGDNDTGEMLLNVDALSNLSAPASVDVTVMQPTNSHGPAPMENSPQAVPHRRHREAPPRYSSGFEPILPQFIPLPPMSLARSHNFRPVFPPPRLMGNQRVRIPRPHVLTRPPPPHHRFCFVVDPTRFPPPPSLAPLRRQSGRNMESIMRSLESGSNNRDENGLLNVSDFLQLTADLSYV